MKQEIKVYDFNDPSSLINMAEVLKAHIVKQKLYENVKGNNYVLVEGWQFAGGLVGVYPKVMKVEPITTNLKPDEIKYEAWVELVHNKTQTVVGTGWAICSNKERGKSAFEEYAVASMAQTRATGKAFRLLLGWVMKATGYEATPAEEMMIDVSDINEFEQAKKMAGSIKELSNEKKEEFLDLYPDFSTLELEELKKIIGYEVS